MVDSKLLEEQQLLEKVEIKKQKKAVNDSIQLKLLNTQRLKPIKVDNEKGGFIKIKQDGWVLQFLSKQQKKLYISPDGSVLLMKSVSVNSKYGTLEYKFERLPSKLKPWYKYAYDFIRITRSKTPRIIYANNLLKCYLMENQPLNNVEVEFNHDYNIHLGSYNQQGKMSKQDVKVFHTCGSDQMEIIFKEVQQGIQLRSLTPLN